AIQESGATTLAAITQALNNRGIRSARGGRWHISAVQNVLARARVRLDHLFQSGGTRQILCAKTSTALAVNWDRPAMITFHRDSSDPRTYNPWHTQRNPA
ncbi:MAG: recombinase family protein, partial [Rhizobiales bacterium]|nr:recombinase family protein [Hyphomicrobiales bacterium]